jgi:NAD+ kinase
MRSVTRVLVVVKRSAYDIYVRRYRMARVRDLLRSGDRSVERLTRADRHHAETLAEVRDTLKSLGLRARFRDRSQIGNVDGFDLVLTLGGDGTLLSASHALGTTPVMGINSAPLDSVGYLCSARRGNVASRLRAAVAGRLPVTKLARMRVWIDGRVVHTRVLNDVLYAHRNPAMTSRYFLVFRGSVEEHKSSGIWVGPAAGSTAAMRSAGGRVLAPTSRLLQFVVREPYTPTGVPFEYARGLARPGEVLEVWNKMREAGLYVDGARHVLPIEIGQRVRFDLSPEPLHVVGFGPKPSGSAGAR